MEQVQAVPHAAGAAGRRRDERGLHAAGRERTTRTRCCTSSTREIRARRKAGGVVWFDFKTLCGGPRSQNDYLEIATQFHTVLLSDVPHMPVRMASEARRFTWLVDVLYDRRVKLIMSAEVPPEALYTEGPLAHEFPRTVSRLQRDAVGRVPGAGAPDRRHPPDMKHAARSRLPSWPLLAGLAPCPAQEAERSAAERARIAAERAAGRGRASPRRRRPATASSPSTTASTTATARRDATRWRTCAARRSR